MAAEATGSPGPKYERVAESLRKRVRSLPVGASIPSERHLAEEFGISRMTARRAVVALMNEGLLERFGGRGTFVTQPSLRVLLAMNSFSADTLRKGKVPGAEVLAVTVEAAEAEGAFPQGTSVLTVERLRTADGQPVAVQVAGLDASLVPGLEEEDLTGSLYQLLDTHYGVRPSSGDQRLLAVACPCRPARQLGISEGAPVLRLERHTYAGGTLVEHTVSWYRSDLYEFTAVLQAQ